MMYSSDVNHLDSRSTSWYVIIRYLYIASLSDNSCLSTLQCSDNDPTELHRPQSAQQIRRPKLVMIHSHSTFLNESIIMSISYFALYMYSYVSNYGSTYHFIPMDSWRFLLFKIKANTVKYLLLNIFPSCRWQSPDLVKQVYLHEKVIDNTGRILLLEYFSSNLFVWVDGLNWLNRSREDGVT